MMCLCVCWCFFFFLWFGGREWFSALPHTTRDSVAVDFDYQGRACVLIDTAGLTGTSFCWPDFFKFIFNVALFFCSKFNFSRLVLSVCLVCFLYHHHHRHACVCVWVEVSSVVLCFSSLSLSLSGTSRATRSRLSRLDGLVMEEAMRAMRMANVCALMVDIEPSYASASALLCVRWRGGSSVGPQWVLSGERRRGQRDQGSEKMVNGRSPGSRAAYHHALDRDGGGEAGRRSIQTRDDKQGIYESRKECYQRSRFAIAPCARGWWRVKFPTHQTPLLENAPPIFATVF